MTQIRNRQRWRVNSFIFIYLLLMVDFASWTFLTHGLRFGARRCVGDLSAMTVGSSTAMPVGSSTLADACSANICAPFHRVLHRRVQRRRTRRSSRFDCTPGGGVA